MDKIENIEFSEQKIVDINMERRVKQAFMEYSMSVITSRALPDARDGMKPGQRRILYAMYDDGLTSDKPFRKSATTVGNVLGHYHPHGDAAVYQTMVRMAQPFALRYPLVEGHGNFGNVDGDGAAAYRYTEARLAKMANEMMGDIEKDVVQFVPNFDNSTKEPAVLPSRFPNLLVNGSIGIAVGMATGIPPHNLCEVIDAAEYMIDNPDASVSDLMQFVKGPDFPTGAQVCGLSGIISAYTTGRGRIIMRAKATVEEEKHRIIVTEIPYQVNKSLLVEGIANLHKDKRVDGITGLRDESGRHGMRIVIEYRRDANGQVILNQLYKYSQLQETYPANMLALVGGEPKILNLQQILKIYVDFQEEIIKRRTKFDLDKALREMHIFEGYKIAIANIDEVIALIKKSENVGAARDALMERFSLSEPQAQAIVDMTLGKLSGLERQKIEERLAKLAEIVAELTDILGDDEKIRAILKNELSAIKNKYGDARRTEIVESHDDIELEDLIEKHTCVITMTHAGYIKRQRADTYTAQHRGGRGITGMTTKEEDFIEDVIVSNSHSFAMFFTNKGRVYTKKAYQIPEASRTAKGTNIVNLLELSEGEHVSAIVPITEFAADEYLTMVTRRGIIKRTLLTDYEYQRKGGKIALSLDDNDELVFVKHTTGNSSIIIATHDGNAVRFEESQARAMGRTARGVIGIRVKEDDEVCGVALAEENKKLITITENGYGKRSEFSEFRVMKNRGGKGVASHNITEKTGRLVSIASVADDDDIMLITSGGTIIRTPVADIPTYSRGASGVIVMRTTGDTKVANFASVANEEKAEELAKEVGSHDAAEVTDTMLADITDDDDNYENQNSDEENSDDDGE